MRRASPSAGQLGVVIVWIPVLAFIVVADALHVLGEFEQAIEAEISDLVVFESKFGADPGCHRSPAGPDRTADYDLTWARGRRRTGIDQTLQSLGTFLVHVGRRVGKTKQIRYRCLLPDNFLSQLAWREQNSSDHDDCGNQ